MRCPDSIDVCVLKKLEISFIAFLRHSPAVAIVKIVSVDAEKHQIHSVEQKFFTFDFNLLKTYIVCLCRNNLVIRADSHNKFVKIRLFCRPFLWIFDKLRKLDCCRFARCNLRFTLADRRFFACVRKNRCLKSYGLFLTVIVFYVSVKRKFAVLVFFVQIGFYIKIAKTGFRLGIEKYFSVNAAKPPHVLILEIACCRKAVNLCTNKVFARFEIFCNIKFVRSHRAG